MSPELIASAQWLPLEFNLQTGLAALVKMDEQQYREASFLDYRCTGGRALRNIPLLELVEEFSDCPGLRPEKFIFHTGYCCSTFLSRCLDVRPALVLREPLVLHGLAGIRLDIKPRTYEHRLWKELLHLALAMLARTFTESQTPVVKLDCNNLWSELCRREPQSRSIFLYQPLDEFLAGVLANEVRRDWFFNRLTLLDSTAAEFQCHPLVKWALGAKENHSHAVAAAAFWIWNTRYFYKRAARKGTIRSLRCEGLLDKPFKAVSAARDFLDLKISDRRLQNQIRTARRIDAKEAERPFSVEMRRKALSEAKEKYRDEIDETIASVRKSFKGYDELLGAPLLEP